MRPISHLKIIFFIPLELSKDPGLTGGEENQQKVAKADDATGGTAKLRLIVISFAVEGRGLTFPANPEQGTTHKIIYAFGKLLPPTPLFNDSFPLLLLVS